MRFVPGTSSSIETARPELYNLARDTSKRRNLFDTQRALAERLLRDLNDHARADAIEEPAAIALAGDRLASLGYVSSGPPRFGALRTDATRKTW